MYVSSLIFVCTAWGSCLLAAPHTVAAASYVDGLSFLMMSWQSMALKPDPDHAPMNADIESNLRRVTPMLIRQPDDEVSIPSHSVAFQHIVESRSIALQHICYSIVTELQTAAPEQCKCLLFIIYCNSAQSQGERVTRFL